jgi:hypothetical protein
VTYALELLTKLLGGMKPVDTHYTARGVRCEVIHEGQSYIVLVEPKR